GCRINGSYLDSSSIWYRVDYDQNGNYDLYESWQPYTGRGSEIVQNLPFLRDGVYHFEFKVEGMDGEVVYSGTSFQEGIADDWIFRIDTVPPTAIETFFVGAAEDEAIQLFWTPSFDVNFAGYRILYAQHPEPGEEDMIWNHLNDPNLINEGSGMVSTTIDGLYPVTRYYFALQALDAAGKIAQYPDYVTAMTTSSAAPKAPQNLVISIEGDQLVLDWDEVTEDTAGNAIQVARYDIFFSEDPYFECGPDNYFDSYNAPPIRLDYIVEYVDRLFVKVRAVTGAIRTKPDPAKKFSK
ncbi:MAG: fibronectin type III domain-containing protein, partial [Candidatus Cloacimonetes bacterium]|nr:fibronectin type III domain-containing protein [Candidatus Cloacimonadota bacterium]